MNIFGRVLGVTLVAGVALFLLTLIVRILVVGAGLMLLARAVGARLLAGRSKGLLDRNGWQSSPLISIDNPAYRTGVSRKPFGRVIG